MFLFLHLPQPQSTHSLLKLIKQDSLSPQEYLILQEQQKIREDIVNGKEQEIQKYFKNSLMILNLVNSRPSYNLFFTFKSCLNIDENKIVNTEQLPPLQAIQVDYIMMKIHWLLYQQHRCLPQYGELRTISLGFKFNDHSDKLVDTILNSLSATYFEFNNSINKVWINSSLETSNSGQYLMKSLYEINANMVLIFKVLRREDYEKLQSICVCTIVKVGQCSKLYEEYKQVILSRIGDYLRVAYIFASALGMWSMVNKNLRLIKKEEYSKKSFLVMSEEIVQLSLEIIELGEQCKKVQYDEDFYDYCNEMIRVNLIPFAQCQIKVYRNISRERVVLKQSNMIELMGSGIDQMDYFSNYEYWNKYL